MQNHVQLNPILADFKRIDIILLIYFYFTYPPQKHVSAIFSVLFAFLSPSSRGLIQIIQFLYFSIITDVMDTLLCIQPFEHKLMINN